MGGSEADANAEAQPKPEAESGQRRPLVYRDFNLRLSAPDPAGGELRVWVEGETPGGRMSPDDAARPGFQPGLFWDDPANFSGGLMRRLERPGGLDEAALYRLSGLLADLALPPGPVRDLFNRSLAALASRPGEGLRLRLQTGSPTLAQLPWEFLGLPQAGGEPKPSDFFALRREVSVVRTDTVEAAPLALPQRSQALIAGLLAAPFDQPELDVSKDREAIEAAAEGLNRAAGGSLVRTRWGERPADSGALQRLLAEGADIFHLAAHAIFDPLISQGQIILEKDADTSELYSGEQLAVLLRGSGARLAVLGACEGGRRDGKNVWGGIAPALFREGIPAVIGSQFRIADSAAILLAAQLYRRVLSGFSVDEALYEARESIFNAGELKQRYWAAPVLYLQHPDGVLFPKASEAGGEAGAFIEVMNELERVEGKAIGAEIESLTNGRVKVSNFVKVVAADATFIGARIGKIG